MPFVKGKALAGPSCGPRRTRVLCLGNPLIEADRAGWLVYRRLSGIGLPPGVELVEAGLAGLGLLGYFEDADRVILIDATAGMADPGQVVLYDCATALGRTEGVHYGHDGGVPYLLGALPAVLEALPSEILLIGLEPPVGDAAVAAAASLCQGLVESEETHDRRPLRW